MVLEAVTPDHLPMLVVAPRRVAEHVWPVERNRWRPDLSLALAAGTPTARRAALQAGCDLTVIGRDVLSDIDPKRAGYRTIVLDELSGFKTRSTARWKAARKLTLATPHVWGLTGTPAPNGLLDLWAQVYLLDGGQRLGRTLGGYRERFFRPTDRLPNGVVIGWELRPGAQDTIHALLSDLALSMRAADLLTDLPPMTVNPVEVSLPREAREVYESLKRDLVASIDALELPVTAASAGVLTNKLSQVAAGFVYDEDKVAHWLHAEKLEALAEVLEQAEGNVLCYYRYKAEVQAVLRRFPQARTIDSPGALADWDKGKIPLLLAHPASAGHGWNAQYGGSHTIVWLSLDWSAELWAQANARLHRQGQQASRVLVHVLQAQGTVDEVILRRLHDKISTQDALMSHLRGA